MDAPLPPPLLASPAVAAVDASPAELAQAAPRPLSAARLAANRRNALRSTGPRTAEGKARSSENALTHGLTAGSAGLDRFAAGPDGGADEAGFLARQLAVVMGQIDALQAARGEAEVVAAYRAEHHWHDDRAFDAARVGSRLARDPGRVEAELRRTPHGCDWLIARWEWVASCARSRAVMLDDAQKAATFDLLGIPGGLREAGPRWAGYGMAADLARSKVDELTLRRDRLAPADELERSAAVAGLSDARSPELQRLRRYENALYRRLGWLVDRRTLVEAAAAGIDATAAGGSAAPAPDAPSTSIAPPPPLGSISAPADWPLDPKFRLSPGDWDRALEGHGPAETNRQDDLVARPHEGLADVGGEGRRQEGGQAPRPCLAGANPLPAAARLAVEGGPLDFPSNPTPPEVADETNPTVVASADETNPTVVEPADETNPTSAGGADRSGGSRRFDPPHRAQKRMKRAQRKPRGKVKT